MSNNSFVKLQESSSSLLGKLPMSLVVITLNEERNLERCLKSAAFIEDIVVVDSFSNDKTIDIAQKFGANIIQEKFLGFSAQKNLGTKYAKYDWILSLDADEALGDDAVQYLQEHFAKLDSKKMYRFSRKSYYWGKWIKHGGWYPDSQVRLFNSKNVEWTGSIHEKLSEKSPGTVTVESTGTNLLHWVFRDITHQVATNNKYSSIQAQTYLESGGRFLFIKFLVKPWVKFVECYFWKLGILDGLPGFIIAVGAAYSVFIRWVKIWEVEYKKI